MNLNSTESFCLELKLGKGDSSETRRALASIVLATLTSNFSLFPE